MEKPKKVFDTIEVLESLQNQVLAFGLTFCQKRDEDASVERTAVGVAAGSTPSEPHVPARSSAAELQAAGVGVPEK